MDHPGGSGSGRAIQSRSRLLTLSHNSSYTGEDEDGASDGRRVRVQECKSSSPPGAPILIPSPALSVALRHFACERYAVHKRMRGGSMGECRWKSVEVLVCWNDQRLGSRYERTGSTVEPKIGSEM